MGTSRASTTPVWCLARSTTSGYGPTMPQDGDPGAILSSALQGTAGGGGVGEGMWGEGVGCGGRRWDVGGGGGMWGEEVGCGGRGWDVGEGVGCGDVGEGVKCE